MDISCYSYDSLTLLGRRADGDINCRIIIIIIIGLITKLFDFWQLDPHLFQQSYPDIVF